MLVLGLLSVVTQSTGSLGDFAEGTPTFAEAGGERLCVVRVGDDVILDQQVRLFQGATIGTDAIVSKYGDHPAVQALTERSLFSLARSVSPAVEGPGGPVRVAPEVSAKLNTVESPRPVPLPTDFVV